MSKKKLAAQKLLALWILFAVGIQSTIANLSVDPAQAQTSVDAAETNFDHELESETPRRGKERRAKPDLIEDSRGLPRVRMPGRNEDTLFPLNEESYVPYKVRRLKNAKVGWVNWAWLREHGYDVPTEGMTPKFEKTLLDAWAYVVPAKDIPAEHFMDVEITHFADRYGGSGGDAGGSGRAGGEGLFQTKGTGRTPLAGPTPEGSLLSRWSWNPIQLFNNIKRYLSNKHHSHGGATLREGLAEATWAEILHRELPYGANRVVAVIVTDLKIGVLGENRVLIIRENSIRPAHFIRNTAFHAINPEVEDARIRKLNKQLVEMMIQMAKSGSTRQERFRIGQQMVVEQIAQKYGTEYVRGFFHGSTSPSNIGLWGNAVDHGPMTALPGIIEAIFADIAPNGDMKYLKVELLNQFFEDIRETVSEEYKNEVLSLKEVSTTLEKNFQSTVDREFLVLAGTPPELVDLTLKTKAGREYIEQLRRIALHENDTRVNVRYNVSEKSLGTFDLYQILPKINAVDGDTNDPSLRDRMQKSIASLMSEHPRIQSDFIDAHLAYRDALNKVAVKNGFNGIKLYTKYASAIRNTKLVELYRGSSLWYRTYSRIMLFKFTGNTQYLQNFVDATIEKNSRTFSDIEPGTLLISQKYDPATGSRIRLMLDGKTGEKYVEVAGHISGLKKKTVNVFGTNFAMKTFEKKSLSLHAESGEVIQASAMALKTNQNNQAKMLTVRYDLPPDSNLELSDVKKFTIAGKPNSIPTNLIALEPMKTDSKNPPPTPEQLNEELLKQEEEAKNGTRQEMMPEDLNRKDVGSCPMLFGA